MQVIEPTPIAPSESFEDLRASVSAERAEATTEKPKRRPGRPSTKKASIADAAPPAPPMIIEPAIISQMVVIPFDIIAARRGDHWKLTDNETKLIGELGSRVITKYSPSLLAGFGDEISLSVLVLMAILTRYQADRRIYADEPKPQKTVHASAQAPEEFGAPTNPYRDHIPRIEVPA